ncbi:MAG TPA: hypothetical protein VF753_03780 [Terriglobales bacterium]
MKTLLTSRIALALVLTATMVAVMPVHSAAQKKLAMPTVPNVTGMPVSNVNWASWMTNLNNAGNANVKKIYQACISHPGACRGLANSQSLNEAIQGVQQQSLSNSSQNLQNMLNISHTVSNTDCAITGGTLYWNRTTLQRDCSH